jgi:hypothetical protein
MLGLEREDSQLAGARHLDGTTRAENRGCDRLARRRERRDDAVHASLHQRGEIRMVYVLLWLLGVPVTLLIILFLLGIGR